MSFPLKTVLAGQFEVEIPRFAGSYEILRVIGEGTYSVICLARGQHSPTPLYACKVVARAILSDPIIIESFERELRILQTVHHPNIVQLIDVVYAPKLIFIIMEHCSKGDLLQHIERHGLFIDTQVRRFFYGILRALEYLHHNNISHRDIKPENILVDGEGEPKIADFSLSHHMKSNGLLETVCGSVFYCAPEVLLGMPYDGRMIDVWSLGIVLCVLCSGRLPWRASDARSIHEQVTRGDFAMPQGVSEQAARLVRKMLNPDPRKRPTVKELLDESWFEPVKVTRHRKVIESASLTGLTIGLPRPQMFMWLNARRRGKQKDVVTRPGVAKPFWSSE